MFPIEAISISGQALYAVSRRADGQVANQVVQAWEAYNPANWALYAIPLTEQSPTGYYRAAYPAWMAGGPLTTEVIYLQGDAAPATSDAPQGSAQSQGASVQALQGDVDAAANLHDNAAAMSRGAAVAGTLTRTQVSTDLPDMQDGQLVGRIILWTSGGNSLNSSYITGSSEGVLDYGPAPSVPAAGDTFLVI